ncbi:hypothetical protein C7B64_14600 [Merismopedia glauca CCAP 1448/3]|uniref:Uncharacterized protein n=1 Tax=Merismopedia glauca CCAP 1448/3 TaxID=1296344 RepID=A0A2T1C1J4_9CYAN|nr:hypothetical protein C7B64_14600 [Merismopedia glauca CCAP 1448/3]
MGCDLKLAIIYRLLGFAPVNPTYVIYKFKLLNNNLNIDYLKLLGQLELDKPKYLMKIISIY